MAMARVLTHDEFVKKEKEEIYIGDIKMTVSCATRWVLLLESLEVIMSAFEEREKNFNYDIILNSVKPHKAITKYINERYRAGLNDLYFN